MAEFTTAVPSKSYDRGCRLSSSMYMNSFCISSLWLMLIVTFPALRYDEPFSMQWESNPPYAPSAPPRASSSASSSLGGRAPPRSRYSRHSAGSSTLQPKLQSDIFAKGTLAFLKRFEDSSKKADENTRLSAQRPLDDDKRKIKSGVPAKKRESSSGTGTTSKTTTSIPERETVERPSKKGKERERFVVAEKRVEKLSTPLAERETVEWPSRRGKEREAPVVPEKHAERLPKVIEKTPLHVEPLSSTQSSNSSSVQSSGFSGYSGNSDTDLDMDVSMTWSQSSIVVPDPSPRLPRVRSSKEQMPPPPTPPVVRPPSPKLHPLLVKQQEHKPKHPSRPSVTSTSSYTIQSSRPPQLTPVYQPTQSSQSTAPRPAGPPALGMRRARTLPTKQVAERPLPSRQKPFKPPLLPSTQARLQQSQTQSQPQVHASHNARYSEQTFVPAPVSPPARYDAEDEEKEKEESKAAALASDPDSSFGEMSFDLDALEETMKMYD